jgi:hypothetical protein
LQAVLRDNPKQSPHIILLISELPEKLANIFYEFFTSILNKEQGLLKYACSSWNYI